MDLKNSLLIVQKKIIEDYTDIRTGAECYMVIRNEPITSQLDSFMKFALDGDTTVVKPFNQAKEDFLRESIYGYIGGHTAEGDYIIKVVGDNLEDKSSFEITEDSMVVNIDTADGPQYAKVKAYKMKLK